MGKLFSLLVLLGLGYAGIYFYYGVVIEKEVEQQLEARGLSSVSVDDVEYDWLAPVSDSANVAVTFSDEVTVQLDSLQALRLGLSFGQ